MEDDISGEARKVENNGGGKDRISPQPSSEEDTNSHASRWDQMFSRLLAFKAKHGKYSLYFTRDSPRMHSARTSKKRSETFSFSRPRQCSQSVSDFDFSMTQSYLEIWWAVSSHTNALLLRHSNRIAAGTRKTLHSDHGVSYTLGAVRSLPRLQGPYLVPLSFCCLFTVSAQRRQYKIVTSGGNGSTAMTVERAKKLVDIGFEWSTINPKHVTWETRYEELKQFQVRIWTIRV